jgi:DNA polymerase III alpha subunit
VVRRQVAAHIDNAIHNRREIIELEDGVRLADIRSNPEQIAMVDAYTSADIRDIEMEMLGIYLSSTPFDRLPEDDREVLRGEAERQFHADDYPEGSRFTVAGIVTKTRPYTAKNLQRMGFIDVETEFTTIDLVVFATPWRKYHKMMKTGTLALVEVAKTDRGWSLEDFTPIP